MLYAKSWRNRHLREKMIVKEYVPEIPHNLKVDNHHIYAVQKQDTVLSSNYSSVSVKKLRLKKHNRYKSSYNQSEVFDTERSGEPRPTKNKMQ